jgi:rhamnulokinase
MATMAAVDLGAQSGRVAVGRLDGGKLRLTEVHRFPNAPVSEGSMLRWDADRLYRETLDGLRAAGVEGGVIDSIGVDSWAVDFGLVDGRGRLLGNPVAYRDARRAAALDDALAKVPARELYARTGIQIMPINTIFELAALAADGDAGLAGAETLLLIPDLMNHRLAGTRVSEYTNATTTQCLDAASGVWADDLLERLGVPTRILPDVVQPGTVLGGLTPSVTEATQLGGARVVAVASHDTASAIAAIPLQGAGSVYISAGTWSLVGVEIEQPLIDDRTFAANLTNEGGVAGTFRLLRNVTGLWLLHECRRTWAESGDAYSFDELVALADGAPALQALIEPNDPAFAPPGDMPSRIREFCVATGQQPPWDAGAVTRCILESLALKQAQTIDVLAGVTGVAPREIHIVGGGARNSLLCRFTADAAGLPVAVGPEEATLLGNLLVQAIALGEIGSLAEAREVVRRSFPATVHEPVASPGWDDARGRFAALTVSNGSSAEVFA